MIYKLRPDPVVNSEQGPITIELEIETSPEFVIVAYLIVGNMRVPCRHDAAPDVGATDPIKH